MEIKLPNIQLVDNAVLIIWNCRVILNESDAQCEKDIQDDDINVIPESVEESSDSEKEDIPSNESCVPHTVVFKCIGATRDTQSQAALCSAQNRMLHGWTVAVRMRPEPTNIADSRAIVFECELDGKWEKIGYVVRDIVHEVHTAMSRNLILSVEFKCIKYVTHWTRSGPGYFAAINVTKSGPWDHRVKLFSSTL